MAGSTPAMTIGAPGVARSEDRILEDLQSGVAVLELRGVRKVFRQGGVALAVLNGVDLALLPGEIVALVGPSGAGKSTLLHVAGLLERPDDGAVLIEGRDCGGLPDEQRTSCAAARSASSISSTICCPNSRRSKTSCCRR